MKTFILIIISVFATCTVTAQQISQGTPAIQANCDIGANSFVQIIPCNPSSTNDSRNGEVFTPKGDIRILIVYAGFDNIVNGKKLGDQFVDRWDAGNFQDSLTPVSTNVPNYVDQLTGAMPGQLFGDTSEFALYCTPSRTNKSLSRYYYYDMSRGKFRLMGGVFRILVENQFG